MKNVIKNVFKRFTSFMLIALMIVMLIPASAIPVYAATSGDLKGLSNSDIGASYTSTDSGSNAKWSADGDTITGTVISTAGTCNDTKYQTTLTLTNKRSTVATLSFDYTIAQNSGTIQIAGKKVTDKGIYSGELAANASIEVYLESGSASSATSISITNLLLISDTSATTTFLPAENGSYTVDENPINENYTCTQSSTQGYAVKATPADGYQFMGWYDVENRKYVSTEASTTLNMEYDATITAKFALLGVALFDVGGQVFDDLDEATAYATTNSITKVTLVSDGTLTGKYTIPNGVVLLIPFDNAKTLYTDTPVALHGDGGKSMAYKTLTLAEGTSLIVNGGISVGGRYNSAAGSAAGYMTGAYGMIKMESGSQIDVKSGGALYAWGFVTGSGDITVESGGSAYEWYQIADFRGGTATMSMGNNVFPFSQYFVQNVEVALTLNAGAEEVVYTGVYASNKINNASITFIGDSGMFKVVSGSVTKKYNGTTDRLEFTINGEMELNNLSLNLAGMNVNSQNYVLPITNNISLEVAFGGKLTINQDAALLAGVQATIDRDAELVISSGNSVYLYDQDEWTADNYVNGGKFKSVIVAPSKVYNRTEDDLVDAKIDVNGTITAAGTVYTTAGGADICSSQGTGIYQQTGTPDTKKVTYQYTQSGSTMKSHEIAITAAKLHNADGTYTETANSSAGDTINYVNGVWGGETATELTVTFNANGGEGSMDVQTVENGVDAVLTGNSFTREHYTFKEWNTAPDGSGTSYVDGATVNFTENTILYAIWTPDTYTVTWVNADGTVLETDTNVVYGVTPEYNGATPSKAETTRYTYSFKGWNPVIAEVTSDITYTAEFDEVGKNGLCVEEEDTYWLDNGEPVMNKGLVRINAGTDETPHYHYYYFGEDGTAVKNGTYKVEINNNLRLPCYNYAFDEHGVIVHDEDTSKNGICEGDGSRFYYIDGVKVGEGLLCIAGSYYYARTSSGEIVRNHTYWITKTNGLPIQPGTYQFDADGKMIINGFVTSNDGARYYYSNGDMAKGFTKIEDDYYFFNAGNGKMYKNATLWVGNNDYGIVGGMYYFNAEGKMVVPDLESGNKAVVSEDGKLYFTIDGARMVSGLYELDGEYYYAQSNGELAVSKSVYVTTELLSGNGWYGFDTEGKLIKTGFIESTDGNTYYYSEGNRAKGLIRIDDDYYLFNAGSGKMYKDATMWVGDNSYGIEGGMYYFNADGKMVVPDLENGQKAVVSENGKLYFTIDGVRMVSGLYELDGEYYYAQSNGELAVSKSIYVTTDFLSGTGWYGFDAEGKFIKNGFIESTNGNTYYYSEGNRVKGFTQIGGDYYLFNAGSGKMYQDATMWVGDNDYGIVGGMYYFDAEGKMQINDLI